MVQSDDGPLAITQLDDLQIWLQKFVADQRIETRVGEAGVGGVDHQAFFFWKTRTQPMTSGRQNAREIASPEDEAQLTLTNMNVPQHVENS